jgi:protein SCO1/2
MAGKEMEHTATVLLFDASGKFAGTIAHDDSDDSALAKMKALIG